MKYKVLVVCLLYTLILQAQEEKEFKTIFGGREIGGFGSFSIGYSLIDTSDALVFSARGGFLLGHTLAMGIGGSGFVTEYKNDSRLNKKGSLAGGYGGVFLELILVRKSPVHISIPVLAGFGGAAYTTWDNEGTEYDRVNYTEDIATFLVLEPGVELEINVLRYLRIAAYFNYRFTSDLEITSPNISGVRTQLVEPGALNTYSIGLIFKFGKF